MSNNNCFIAYFYVVITKKFKFPRGAMLLDVLDVRLRNAVALTLEISPDDMIIERIWLTVS